MLPSIPQHHVTCLCTKFEVARRRCIYKKIHHLTQNVARYPLHHVTYSGTKFQVAMSKGLGGDAFARKYYLTFGSTHNIAQYPLHYVSYLGTKF